MHRKPAAWQPAFHLFLVLAGVLALFVIWGARHSTVWSANDNGSQNATFFTETGGDNGSGYYVRDGLDASDRPQRFYSEFQRLGGVDTLGYPISRPFVGAGGFTYQAFQRAVLQWRPEANRAVLANTFEWLQQAGRDPWLSSLGVPPPVDDDGSGGDWKKGRDTRLAWLTNPEIKLQYYSAPGSSKDWTVDDAIQVYGLPMSSPERRGPFVVQRFQRIGLQFWLDSVAGMPPAGSVVGVLGGDMLKKSGLVPDAAAAPEQPDWPAKDVAVKGLYLSYHAAGRDNYLQRIYDLSSSTQVNGVVVDVKSEFGYTTFPSEVRLAKDIGAASKPTVADFSALVARLHQRGLYVIARLPVFKDDLLARSHPEWAIVDSRTSRPWLDAKGLAWTDPFRQEVWDYNIALAKEAALRGVDEIQFDYIRFPGANSGDGQYSQGDNPAARAGAVNGFLDRARTQLRPMGPKLAADLFGYTIWKQGELGIGQNFDEMTKYLDVVSPMLYPSSFSSGIPGHQSGVQYPYEIVLQSIKRAISRIGGKPVKLRPWLQDFADYSYDGRAFGPAEVSAQIRGATEAGASGWLLWNSSISYTREALGTK